MFLIIFLMLVGFAVLAFYKRPINTQLGWAPPPHVLFGQPPAAPQPPAALQPPVAAPEITTSAPATGSGPVERLATFAPPPAAPSSSTFAPPPAPGSIKVPQPPPVDLNDLFNRPNA